MMMMIIIMITIIKLVYRTRSKQETDAKESRK